MHRNSEFQGWRLIVRYEIFDGGQIPVETISTTWVYELSYLIGLSAAQLRQLFIQTGPPVEPVDPPGVPLPPFPPPLERLGNRLLQQYLQGKNALGSGIIEFQEG